MRVNVVDRVVSAASSGTRVHAGATGGGLGGWSGGRSSAAAWVVDGRRTRVYVGLSVNARSADGAARRRRRHFHRPRPILSDRARPTRGPSHVLSLSLSLSLSDCMCA